LPGGGYTISTLTGPLTIGTGVTTVNQNDFFFGSVDEIRLYAGALTPTELSRLYTVTQP